MEDIFLFSPTRFLRLWVRGAWRQYWCGRRFGHFRAEGWPGYAQCARCRVPMI